MGDVDKSVPHYGKAPRRLASAYAGTAVYNNWVLADPKIAPNRLDSRDSNQTGEGWSRPWQVLYESSENRHVQQHQPDYVSTNTGSGACNQACAPDSMEAYPPALHA